MQFIKEKNFFKVARITGPTHNLLSIRLSKSKCSPKITPLPVKRGEIERLKGEAVLTQVLAGLDIVNKELQKQYFVLEIQFIPSDSQPASVYNLLVQELIKRIDSNGEFVVVL
ncbi:hypothetical protein NX722_09175 [Endozoicomonas gorgoniicola]|uniref:Uncharacterized protein n=1 Tax=Endozoicomonas gorgoniicola TaxID=1234144 RepID=A0ABT3MTU3_9GAMM|nr:hypothetical protein [Endozoicomonas gorgoniicola]MCW7552810.1 hypothetical protein [Endozoicomonas gorgoniicola]